MTVAVLYNPKPEQIRQDLPEDRYEEYDSEETVAAIAEALAETGVHPVPVVADQRIAHRLERGFDFVFNIAEGEAGRCREAVPAAVCELLHLPYTGSDPLTLGITLDKAVARRVVSPDVPVARAATKVDEMGALRYPLFVKPNAEGSSIGIRQQSLCRDPISAQAQWDWLQSTYGCAVLAEEWLCGPEVTVGIAGNGKDVRVLAMMEIAPAEESSGPFVYSLQRKREFRTRVRYHVPPRLPAETLDLLQSYALRAYDLLGCRDIARIDFRLDDRGKPHFIECNPLPGLNPASGDLVIATRSTIGYRALVGGILRDAAARHGISL